MLRAAIDPSDEAPDGKLGDHLQHDVSRIRMLLENQARYTNSRRAKALLEDFDGTLKKFLKITPRDYARALRDMRAEAGQPEGAALEGDD